MEVKALRSKAKQNAKWETGFVKNNVIPSQIIEQEKGIIYTATIAIMTATDYLSASLNPSCATGSNFNLPCKGKNWMSKNNPSGNEFTLTPLANSSTGNLWIFGQATPYAYIGSLRQKSSYYNAFIRPVGYLDSNTIFTGGTGTESDPYTLS